MKLLPFRNRHFLTLALGLIYTYLLYSTVDLDIRSVSENYRDTFGREPPKGFSAWVRYARQHGCLLEFEYYNQIYKDLEPWMNGRSIKKDFEIYSMQNTFDVPQKYLAIISHDASSGLFSANGLFKYFSIPKALFYIGHLIMYDLKFLMSIQLDEPFSLPADNDANPYRSWEDAIRANSCIRNVSTFIRESHGFFLGPETFATYNGLIPMFSQDKHPCFKDIMIPHKYHFVFSRTAVNDPVPWDKKKSVLFWRGGTTSGSFRKSKPWQKYHRVRLVDWEKKWASTHPDSVFDAGTFSNSLKEVDEIQKQTQSKILVDIGFHAIGQFDEETRATLISTYHIKSPVSFIKTLNFKYLLVVDGNGWPSRIQNYLQTNSVILYSGIFIDYYLAILKPWIHYVPVRVDLADLEEKIDWLISNDDKAHKIAQNAKALMSKLGSFQQSVCYTGLLLQEYGRLYHESD